MENIYFFHWPSSLGGADTRLKDLIQLFSDSKKYNLFCIPNDDFRLEEKENVSFLKENNVKILTWDTLPSKSNGYAIAFCNFRLFQEKWRLEKINEIGLKFIWSNDMMWTTKEESKALNENLVSATIFTSEFHKNKLISINSEFNNYKNFIVPNYFHEDNYENLNINKHNHLINKFVIGKLSRAEWTKYSENFPLFYNSIDIPNIHFRFMGWNDNLAKKYNWFNFNSKFELLEENKETPLEFLKQLDLYVFTCHHNYIENQSRSIIEAQLIGIPCIAPNEGNFPNMIWHTRNGYLYNSIEECFEYINHLYYDQNIFDNMKINTKKFSRSIWCDKRSQLNIWEKIFLNI